VAGVAASVAALVVVTYRECEDICGTLLIAPYAVGGGAVVGALVGRLIGRSILRIEWRRVAVPIRLGVRPEGRCPNKVNLPLIARVRPT
jgi:NhaP-type Na+/H+ or K+/H+ antiporter